MRKSARRGKQDDNLRCFRHECPRVCVDFTSFRHRCSAYVGTLLSGEVIPLYNDEILQEYDEVLHRVKFHLPESLVDATIHQIKKDGIASERIHTEESFPDPTDIVFYEVALSKKDSFLVTGNTKHFPKNPIVVTPAEFLKLIGKQ